MEVDQDCHHFAHTQPRGWPALAPDAQQLGILRSRQPLTEIIDMTEQFEYTHREHLA